ncbi:membrane protein [Pseudidiomarina salinarum]|uniref:Membrane protein n=1 Tax=Pseudidiomarina salinarum TaxID=435908 RepID=A0A094L7X5_9GAMM|nr:putative sulfate exporter family transporter [Pseudidiomarina salinarum]KFZ30868.1 membrane protein [Pseudidiomarina salinarum]RUO71348.1 putative sulfate exporter family transporter [Pseudidiomarina salinarum]
MSIRHLAFWLAALLCLTPLISAPLALIIGFALAAGGLVPAAVQPALTVKKLLAVAIIALGFGVQFDAALQATADNLGLMLVSVTLTLVMALVIARWLRLDYTTAHLIGSGSAICGGSAIAAVGPAMRARADQMAIALACVFALNAVALLVFPVIGRWLTLDSYTFGVWAAIAIHDTSSVVGAAQAYSDDALVTATTVKLARALLIVPLVLLTSMIALRRDPVQGASSGLPGIPLFIFGYLAAIAIATLFPAGAPLYDLLFSGGKQLLVLCLFLVGCSITPARLRAAGAKPMLLAVLLWLFISIGSLLWLLNR